MSFINSLKELPQVSLFITIGIIALLINAWVPYQTLDTLTSNAQLRRQAKEALEEVDEVLVSMLNIETAKRGYTITGNISYLDPLVAGERDIHAQMQRLASSLETIPSSKPYLQVLENQIQALILEANKVRKLRDESGRTAAQLHIESGVGKSLMDQLRATCKGIKALSNNYLTDLRKKDGKNIRKTKITIITLTIADTLLFGIAFLMLYRSLLANRKANEALKDQSVHLNNTNTHLHQVTKDLAKKQNALELSEAQFRASFDTAAIGMALVSPEGKWLKVNKSLCRILGRTEPELLSSTFQDVTHPDDLEKDLELVQELLHGQREHYSMEKRYFDSAKNIIWVNLSVSLVRDEAGNPVHFVSQIEDITETKNYRDTIEHLAHYDQLTKLPNRRLINDRIEQARVRSQRYLHLMAIAFIDVDYFKAINDTYGHDVGDLVLVEAAARLSGCIRATDTLGRQGGDEFILVVSDAYSQQDVVTVMEKIMFSFEDPIDIKANALTVSLSIGVVIYDPQHEDTLPSLLKKADMALYEVKAKGRKGYEIFSESITPSVPS